MYCKLFHIGTIKPEGRRCRASVYIKVVQRPTYISFTGAIGPRPGGNAIGGCGQIVMEFAHRNPADNDGRFSRLIKPKDFHFAKGWDEKKLFDLIDAWELCHLKDNIPVAVLNLLETLPPADKTPCWS